MAYGSDGSGDSSPSRLFGLGAKGSRVGACIGHVRFDSCAAEMNEMRW